MRDDLTAIYRAAVAAVDPARLLLRRVSRRGATLEIALAPGRRLVRRIDRLWVAGAGKAAVAMAAAIASLAPEIEGMVLAPRPPRGSPPRAELPRGAGIKILPGDHPIPGADSFRSTARILAALAALPTDSSVLFLLSGGASALFAAPAPGITRADKIALNAHLLRCGASIDVMNAVRKHVSRVKGGGFALLAAPREVVTLALSDVPGDALATIGSGPAVPDPSTFARALRALEASAPGRRGVPAAVWRRLEAGAAGAGPEETPKAADPRLQRTAAALIGSNRTALAAAAQAARQRGYSVLQHRLRLRGEAADCARSLVASLPRRVATPLCVLAGGETAVTVGSARGVGGRCQELALAAAAELGGTGWSVLCAGTDGIDGRTDAAGAFCDGRTIARGGRRRAARALREHDAYPFFARLGDLFQPGPTGTNVMDVVIALHPGGDARRASLRYISGEL